MSPLTDKGRSLLQWHLAELAALEKRLESDHIARPIVAKRIEECKDHLNA
jgi:hypothetical protein